MKKVVALVVGRAGSKGILNKNLKELGGVPLVGWPIRAAVKSKKISEVVVSSDGSQIIEVAKNYGAKHYFDRPPELSEDTSLVVDAIKHAILELRKLGKVYDYVALLQPTSPFLKTSDIDRAVDLLLEKGGDTLVTVYRNHHFHPNLIYRKNEEGFIEKKFKEQSDMVRRQELEPLYLRAGNLYIFSVEHILETGTLYGEKIVPYEINDRQVLDIDSEKDLWLGEMMLKSGLLEESE